MTNMIKTIRPFSPVWHAAYCSSLLRAAAIIEHSRSLLLLLSFASLTFLGLVRKQCGLELLHNVFGDAFWDFDLRYVICNRHDFANASDTEVRNEVVFKVVLWQLLVFLHAELNRVEHWLRFHELVILQA